MKAIVVQKFGDENVLRYTDTATPAPGAGQVRVRLHAAGVNPVDTYIRSGKYAMGLPALPYTPGNDGAGVVDALGEGVDGLQPGQRVFVASVLAKYKTGTYAEYVVCDAGAVHPLPGAIRYAEGAGIGTPGLAAACALFCRAKVRPEDTVLVHGASGGVGTLAVQLARRTGARVFGTAGTPEGLETVKKLGAHGVFNHKDEEYVPAIRKATGGKGVNVVIEMIASLNLTKDFGMLAKHGRIVVVGSRGSLEFDPRLTMTADADIRGMTLGNLSHKNYVACLRLLGAALEDGVRPIVNAEMPLQDAPQAHRDVMGENKTGKIILTM